MSKINPITLNIKTQPKATEGCKIDTILLSKIITLGKFFEFYFRKKLLKTMKNKIQLIPDMAAFSLKYYLSFYVER